MSKLPDAAYDHFRKANALHGYVLSSLADATEHALKAGEELQAAKSTVPHGGWEHECSNRFDGSLRTAQFYMQFYRHVSALPKAQASALLVLEGTLEGAAKAAKNAIKESSNTPSRQGVISDQGNSGGASKSASLDQNRPAVLVPNSGTDADSETRRAAESETGDGPSRVSFPSPSTPSDSAAIKSGKDGRTDSDGNGLSQENSPATLLDGTERTEAPGVVCPNCGGSGRVQPTDSENGFAEFWRVITESDLPKTARLRKSRGQAQKAHSAAVGRLAKEGYSDPCGLIRSRMELYVAAEEAVSEGAKYCPLAATWLNGERYLETPDQWANPSTVGEGHRFADDEGF